MNSLELLAPRLQVKRLVPVVVIEDPALAPDLARCLERAGLDVIEITFRTAAAAAAIQRIVEACPAMFVGAGTLLDPSQVRQARDAGARFGMAPGLDERVLDAAEAENFPFVPGVMTPSEVQRAWSRGCRLQKFFPAEQAGGAPMLKALAGPFGHTGLRFIPTGGLQPHNLPPYLSLPCVAALGGSWFVEPSRIRARDWAGIEETAKKAVALTTAV